ncbi:Magnesium-transporting ATPase, P-type 1 [compost metagenome]
MVYLTTVICSLVAIVIPYTFIGGYIGLVSMPMQYISVIIIVSLLYCIIALYAKKKYIKKYQEWI